LIKPNPIFVAAKAAVLNGLGFLPSA